MKPSVPDPQQPTAAPAKPAAKPAASVPSSVAARRYIDSATAAQKKAAAKPVVNTAAKPAVNIEEKPAAVQEENKPQAPKDDTKVRSDTSALDAILSGATAEMPKMRKKTSSDAFFAQSDAPQIGRTGKSARSRAVIDLEDALATASAKESKKPANTSGRKSAAILASKSRSELMTDEDDSRDRSRYDVDDILSGIERRR